MDSTTAFFARGLSPGAAPGAMARPMVARPAIAQPPMAQPPMPQVMGRRLVRSRDLAEIFANVPKWQIEHQMLSRPVGISQSGMMNFGTVGLASNRFNALVRATGGVPRGQIAIGLDIAGRPGRQFGGRKLGGNDALIGYSGAELDYLHPPGFVGLSLTLPGELLELALAQRGTGSASLSPYRAARICRTERATLPDLWALFDQLAAALHSSNAPFGNAVTGGFIQAELVDAAATLVGHHQQRAAEDDRHVWHHRRPIVYRAEEFMRANIAEPITLHQICAAARASERTVEYAFRDVYRVGAKRFLKLLRLNHVHRQLDRKSVV